MTTLGTIQSLDAADALSRLDVASVDLIYVDPPFLTNRDFGAFSDKWDSMDAYVEFLRQVSTLSRTSMRDTGNFVIHVDPRTSHYVKVMLDSVFGPHHFRNEVIWNYASGGASKRHLSKKHDTLLWYTRTDQYKFNVLREPYKTPKVDGRAGFHPEGRMLTDVWEISFISTTSKERTGYPTQKPLKLIDRVIQVWTDPGDLVVDPFCGSGTTAAAAAALGRRYAISDIGDESVAMARERLSDA